MPITARVKIACLLAPVLLALCGCKGGEGASSLFHPDKPDLVDPALNLSQQDYINMLRPADGPTVTFKAHGGDAGPPIPALAPILAAPEPPKLGTTKLVSIAVTDDVPLKDVLLELARLANVDIEVDAGITGGIAFRATDRPFNEVIDRISELAGLRYKIDHGVLMIERDTPYVKIYPIDFLNIERQSTNSLNLTTNVLSGGMTGGMGGMGGGMAGGGMAMGGAGGGGLNSGSNSSITSKSDSDFWKKFEEGIADILQYHPAVMTSAVTASPAAAAAGAHGAPLAEGSPASHPFYILNRQGGTLIAAATERQHALIKQFIQKLQRSASAQVLIDAKILEVTLDRQFQSGIDWSKIGGNKINFSSNFGTVSDPANAAILNLSESNLAGLGVDLNAAVKLTELFGTTRTLSSPRLHAINNQQAVLTFAQNQVYFQVSVQQNTTTSTVQNTLLTVNSAIQTVPIGIILSIQPSINLDTNEVTLDVRPTLSRIVGYVSDPAVAFLVAQAQAQGSSLNISNQVPVVEVRELDSILKLKSGQVMVIGGLMQDSSDNTENGIPYVQSIPFLGSLFKGINRTNNTQELVIFLRATIIDSNGYAHDADKALYNKFATDPRPLNFK